MICYKYSLLWDFRWAYRTLKTRAMLKREGLIVFLPSMLRMIRLWVNRPHGEDLALASKKLITCYWISSGTWGAYIPPDKIFICPWKRDGTMYTFSELRKVIYHEILHIEYSAMTHNLSFQEKEEYIREKMKDIED